MRNPVTGHSFHPARAVPLLNIDEFERPLLLVTVTAERLERELVGGDKY
jgi:hypothetical protein